MSFVSVASRANDQACQELFQEAGYMLGTHLRAISMHIENKLYNQGTLQVVAVGSVFRSWKFLRPGQLTSIADQSIDEDQYMVEYLQVFSMQCLKVIVYRSIRLNSFN